MKKLGYLLLASMLCLAGCSPKAPEVEGTYKAGTYTGTAKGNNADVVVEVVFSDEAIDSVTVKEHQETAGLADPALENVPADIVKYQSLAVDTVAGATNTSKAILNAVEDCVNQAGGDIEALKAPIEKEEVKKTEETRESDVVVVGSGITGMAAAIAAAEKGAKVVVIEKMPTTGGTTAISGGFLIAVDSDYLEGSQYDITLDEFRAYWEQRMAVSGQESGYPDYERWTAVFSKTGDTVDWLGNLGVQWNEEATVLFGPYPVIGNKNLGRGLIDDMITIATGLGVEVITECTGKELIVDENGAVTGIIAETADSVITYNSSSVILATGGVSGNAEMVANYSPKVAQAQTISIAASSSTGDGLTMALNAGAAAFDEFFTSISSTTIDPAFAAAVSDASKLTTSAQLGFNAKGERISNETVVVGDMLGSALIQDGNAPFYYLFDSSNTDTTAILEKGVEANAVVKADTIEGLADALGIDSATLKATYDTYMGYVANGVDEEFGKAADYLVALETAPYYAVKWYPTTFGSQGGVLTDLDGRVLNTNGETIPGLYAAGEMSNRYYYNENYLLAASLGIYATTGRMAGEAAGLELAK